MSDNKFSLGRTVTFNDDGMFDFEIIGIEEGTASNDEKTKYVTVEVQEPMDGEVIRTASFKHRPYFENGNMQEKAMYRIFSEMLKETSPAYKRKQEKGYYAKIKGRLTDFTLDGPYYMKNADGSYLTFERGPNKGQKAVKGPIIRVYTLDKEDPYAELQLMIKNWEKVIGDAEHSSNASNTLEG